MLRRFGMSNELHCYEYVDVPFEGVRDLLDRDATGLFQRATQTAQSRAQGLVASLKVSIAGFEVGKNVVIRVKDVSPCVDAPDWTGPHATRIELTWQAQTSAALFPSMHASLLAYPLSPTETQLDLRGVYEPPGGLLGSAADRLVGHRIARASVHRFLDEVASEMRQELA